MMDDILLGSQKKNISKNILITGGSSGIGYQAVKELINTYQEMDMNPEIWPRTATSIAVNLFTDNLKRSGGFLPGIRPGGHTEEYIDNVMSRLTVWGSIYMIMICLRYNTAKNITAVLFH